MKKSKLMKQNLDLYGKLDSAEKKIKALEKELETVKAQLKAQIEINEKIKSEAAAPEKEISEPLGEVQKSVVPTVEKFSIKIEEETSNETYDESIDVILEDDMQYAADRIGELVIESAKYSNRLTEGGDSRYIELVNLVLGKTEVSKADILAITKQEIPLVIKKQKMDAVKSSTIEYFESVMGQIN